MREVIAAPRAGLDLRAHYGHHQSPAVRAGGLIFCSGMLPVDPDTGERRHGTLQRSVSLATPIDSDKAHAQFEHGVLTLKLPKSEKARPKQIKVNG